MFTVSELHSKYGSERDNLEKPIKTITDKTNAFHSISLVGVFSLDIVTVSTDSLFLVIFFIDKRA